MKSSEPRRTPHDPPHVIAGQDILPVMRRIIEQKRAARNSVLRTANASGDPCQTKLLQPLLDVDNETSGAFSSIVLLRYASPSKGYWDAAEEAVRLAKEDDAEFVEDPNFFRFIEAVNNHLQLDGADDEQAKFAKDLLRKFRRSGHGQLHQRQIEFYLEKQNAVNKLCTQYRQNLTNSEEGIWLSPDDLDGVPKQDLLRFRQESQSRLEQYFVRLTRVNVRAILRHAENPATRKHVCVADEKKMEANEAIFVKVMRLRHDNALLLGYNSHANFKLEERMVRTTKQVNKFLQQLQKELVPAGKNRTLRLLERKQKHLKTARHSNPDPDSVPLWDYSYYNRLEQEAWNLDHRTISEYFPLEVVITRVLHLLRECLQLHFEELTCQEQSFSLWHEDVSGWRVWDERPGVNHGEFIGYLYFDLLTRANKFSGSQSVTIQSSYVRKDGSRVYPSTVVMCSFTPAPTGKCTLLEHSQLVSLFHECGHAMHDLLSRTRNTAFHGHRSPPDFCEVPSSLFEKWCCIPQRLVQLSCHYSTLNDTYLQQWQADHPGMKAPQECLSEETAVALLDFRKQNLVSWYLWQLAFAKFDMAVHDLKEPNEHGFASLWYRILEELELPTMDGPEAQAFPCADFQHLLKGYDAGCHSYLIAHVVAANIFESHFAADPCSHERWEVYRNAVLRFGASQNEVDLLTRYLSHPLDPEALLRSIVHQNGT